jgi:tripeptide aminopeptidase
MSRLWETFSALTAIDSPSFGERALCSALKERLGQMGAQMHEDGAGALFGGSCGNLYAFLPGSLPLPPLLLSAHMDTVEPGRGKKAVLGARGVITSSGDTILGADDVAGIAVILEALTRLDESGTPRRPAEVLFTVAEERYGLGSAAADYSRIRAKEAYTLDLCGGPGQAANAAPTLLSFELTVTGRAAHAGLAAQDGVNAIAAAAKAIARVPQGAPQPGVTVNIGKITGGEAGNIIPARCSVTGEIRSLSHEAAGEMWEHIRGVFAQECEAAGASLQAEHRVEITAYATPREAAVVRRFEKACESIGVTPDIHPTMGGSDQNNFARHDIEGLVMACAMYEAHSTREYCRLDELEQCVGLLMALLTDETAY